MLARRITTRGAKPTHRIRNPILGSAIELDMIWIIVWNSLRQNLKELLPICCSVSTTSALRQSLARKALGQALGSPLPVPVELDPGPRTSLLPARTTPDYDAHLVTQWRRKVGVMPWSLFVLASGNAAVRILHPCGI
jgi:hypothetical protein